MAEEKISPKGAAAAIAGLLAAIGITVVMSYTKTGHIDSRPAAVFICTFLFLAACVGIMAAALRRSMKKTLYSYKNIMLASGIVFAFTFAAVTVSFIVSVFGKKNVSVKDTFAVLLEFPKTFSFYALFLIAVLCLMLAVSNISLMRHEGYRPRNALSLALAIFYIGGAAAVYFIVDFVHDKLISAYSETESALFVSINTALPLFLFIMVCYFECVLIGTAFMGYKAARQVPAYDKDFIIILGCSVAKDGGLLPLLKGRVNRAMRYAWEQEIASGKPVKYLPSGGKGSDEKLSEASAMELYLLSKGAEDYEVIPEKNSTTTKENMVFSKQIIDSINPDAKVAFATTNYHMLRSGILAQRAGIDAEGIAGDTKWYFWPNGFIREFFALLLMNVKAHINVAIAAALFSIAVGIVNAFVIM
ncbi:MAG: YdcF family protein [Clostridiales bacterium]|nr:YdcF family protein [Candidatus Equinaster intestinalis]